MTKMHDVIVVGAGPIGNYTAYLLAKKGFDVAILEKHSRIGENINCTGIISKECFEKFDLSKDAVIKPLKVIKAFSPSGNYIRYKAESPLAYIVDRSTFDSEINKKALRKGATLYLNTRVEKIRITDNAFKVKTKGGRGELSSRIGVIATGFELNSFAMPFKKSKNFLCGVQTDVEIEDIKDVEVYFGRKITRGSFAWVVPTNGNAAKIGLISKENPTGHLNKFLRNSLISHRLNGHDNLNIKCSPIPFGKIPKSYAERLIVVGEAAGQVKTTTGGGIYFGLVCSEIAAQTIIKAFEKKDFSEKALKEYEARWKNKLEPELKIGVYARNLLSRLSDSRIDALFSLAKKDGVLSIIRKQARFDWHKDLIISLLQNTFFKKFRI